MNYCSERYRDLLEASTSIVSMSDSSERVVNTLDKVKVMIATDQDSVMARSPRSLGKDRSNEGKHPQP